MPWSGKLKAVEEWASVNPERERLLVILIIATLGMLVLVAVGIGPDERATGAPVLTNASAEGAADGRMIIHEPGRQTANQYRIGTAFARSSAIMPPMRRPRSGVRLAPDAHHTDRAAVRQDDGRTGHAAADVLRSVLDP